MDIAMISNLTLLAIPLVAPLLTTLTRKLLPKIPGAYLPIVCTLMGVGLDLLASWATGTATPPWYGVALGAAGVAVREALDQVKKGNTTPPPPHVA